MGRALPPPHTKADLRAWALARRDALDEPTRRHAAADIARHVASLPLPPGAVAAYWPIRSEADVRPAADLLRARGHDMALPCITDTGLLFRLWRAGDELAAGRFGLCEPLANAPQITPASLLVPLAAFDRRGHRIGYGKGFYDRAIAGLAGVLTVGIGFATQEISAVPDEPHDQRLDFVVTERDIIGMRSQI